MLFIRADGNAKIGTGHLMRCLTIAEKVKSQVLFLCADLESTKFIQERGYHCRILGIEAFSEAEAKCLTSLVAGGTGNCLLIDSYLAAPAYVEALSRWIKTAYMDDMGKEVYPADIVINYNAFADREAYEALYSRAGVKMPRLLIGSNYIPVRDAFKNKNYLVKKEPKSLLLTTGGGDAENLAGGILQSLLNEPFLAEMQMHVVSGAFNPHYDALLKQAEAYENVTVYRNVQDMASLMASCDMAVTAGGSTVYELCALGVPFVCFSYAENQDALITFMEEQDIALSAGRLIGSKEEDKKRLEQRICGLVTELAASLKNREKYSGRERELVDGSGALRLAEALDTDIL